MDSEKSEAEFLAQQAKEAEAGMGGAGRDLGEKVWESARLLAKEHPIATVAASAAVGFLAAGMMRRREVKRDVEIAATAPAEKKVSAVDELLRELAKAVMLPAVLGIVEAMKRPREGDAESERGT